MYFATNDVHVPRFPHDRFRGKNPMGLRGDAIAQFDWTVGQLMETLDQLGLTEKHADYSIQRQWSGCRRRI